MVGLGRAERGLYYLMNETLEESLDKLKKLATKMSVTAQDDSKYALNTDIKVTELPRVVEKVTKSLSQPSGIIDWGMPL